MPRSRGQTEASRARAFGALVRELRRERRLTQDALAERVHMSAANVSRIEVGAQGPPGDETIHAFADALDADAGELLKAAGRSLGGPGFEEAVLAKLDQLTRDVRDGFARLEEAGRD